MYSRTEESLMGNAHEFSTIARLDHQGYICRYFLTGSVGACLPASQPECQCPQKALMVGCWILIISLALGEESMES